MQNFNLQRPRRPIDQAPLARFSDDALYGRSRDNKQGDRVVGGLVLTIVLWTAFYFGVFLPGVAVAGASFLIYKAYRVYKRRGEPRDAGHLDLRFRPKPPGDDRPSTSD